MNLKTQLYIDFLEYAIDYSPVSKFEVFKPVHSTNCKEYFIKGISLGAPTGRLEWSCSVDCPTNGISPSVISSIIDDDFEEEEE